MTVTSSQRSRFRATRRSTPTTLNAWRAWRPMDAAFPDVIP